jgi:glucose-6-phosphate isomerase
MYRGIEEKGDLRYDITIIPSQMMGSEFNKTKGHQHCGSFQELYTVLEGEAILLMQKQDGEKIEDVFAVLAKAGQSVIVPSGYGHITINRGETDLKMSNWVSKKCPSQYELFEKLQGACYYFTKLGWIKNKNYEAVPELRFEEPLESVPTDLDFLN